MKCRVIVLEPAAEELVDAAMYYDSKQTGLGIALLEEWDESLIQIQRSPEGYQKKKKNFRQARLNRFPYLIIFEIEGSDIFINSFIDARRHPNKRYAKKKK